MTAALEAAGWQQREDAALPEMVRPLWVQDSADALAFGFQTRRSHDNGRDMVHGGILALFADHGLGMTVRRAVAGAPAATIHLDLNYIAAARPGVFVEVRSEILRRTRSVVFVRGTLTGGGTLLATASGVWKLLAQPSPGGDG